jgi:hypothetical protein
MGVRSPLAGASDITAIARALELRGRSDRFHLGRKDRAHGHWMKSAWSLNIGRTHCIVTRAEIDYATTDSTRPANRMQTPVAHSMGKTVVQRWMVDTIAALRNFADGWSFFAG